ncbi:CDP-diacylglycerol--glycerol-3-phosphate 3-phosphatidyltransferase [Actinocorallia longicatena]|uniref:CDP-diacylglycerol--glycerol-3-phosphate 3-phosphatidyltransferase n=1 Tax=Actinocorallia longicatena TaxID=111803 RepID=A0ABP6QLR4_9ACTN
MVSNLNFANALTVLRLVLVPPFVLLMLLPDDSLGWRNAALAVFLIAAVSDWLDGHLARTWSLSTKFGALWDPIADKALTGAAFICLSILGELWWWVTIVILVREIGITLLRIPLDKRGVDVSAGLAGKAKTALQMVALTIFISPRETLLPLMMGAALFATVWSGLLYLRDALPRLREPRP